MTVTTKLLSDTAEQQSCFHSLIHRNEGEADETGKERDLKTNQVEAVGERFCAW